MDVVNPLSIILVKSDSKGDRLLFRYPYNDHNQPQHRQKLYYHHTNKNPTKCYSGQQQSPHNHDQPKLSRHRNPYAAREDGTGSGGHGPEDILQSPPPQTSNIIDGQLCGFTDEVLSTLFAVKPELCNRKFELKVNDVRFVAHPTLMQQSLLGMQTPQHQQPQFNKSNFNKDIEDRSNVGCGNMMTTTTLSSASSLSPPVIVIIAQPPSSNTNATAAAVNIVPDKNGGDVTSSSSSSVSPQQASAATNNSASTSSASTATTPVFGNSATNSNVTGSNSSSSILINIVFALHAQASYSIVKCYYELSKRLGHALVYEEKRVGYLSDEMRLMVKTHDETPIGIMVTTHGDGDQQKSATSLSSGSSAVALGAINSGSGGELSGSGTGGSVIGCGIIGVGGSGHAQAPSAFDLILERSTLAQCLKSIYHDLCTTGLLNTTINQWVTLSFCLPQKAHQFHKRGVVVEPEAIDRCLQSLKPYHGMLLLVDLNELLDCFPPSGARMLLQLLNAYNPLKTLQNMAAEADLAIQHVYELVGHLVYWAKATIIYPLCETNVYVIAPDAPLHSQSPLVEKFTAKFPGMSLFEVISDFSLPTSIGHLTTPLQHPTRQGTLAQMVLWMLQHHLLMQLHTYVQFMPTEHGECSNSSGGADTFNATGSSGHQVVENDDDDENAFSVLTISSNQPAMHAPDTSRRSITDNPTSTISYADDDDDDEIIDHAIDENETINSASVAANQHQFRVTPHSPVTFCSSNDTNTTTTSTNTTTSTTNNTSVNTTAESAESADSLAGSVEDEDRIKELLMAFHEPERSAVRDLSAASNADDLALMVKLWQAGYFKGEHHLEEIMYFENLRRSQLLQLLDKFRDVLIIYETEDPAIATLYTQTVE